MGIIPQILLLVAVAFQIVAAGFALRLVRKTKYNSVWILFIIGFILLTALLVLMLLFFAESVYIGGNTFIVLGSIVSLCLSVGVMYAHKLFEYVDRLNRRQELYNRRLLTAILRTEEKSRSHFAKELHDGTGPLLSAAKMSLTALVSEHRAAERSQLQDNALLVIDEAIRSLREISNNMQPQILNDFGLARGVRNFIDKITMRSASIDFATDLRDERFDPDVEVIMYRVICELINNSLKHSGCNAILISLTCTGGVLALDYVDDGCGFDLEEVADSGRGMGLSNISSRMDSLNGRFEIKTRKGEGMHARARVDVHRSVL